MDWEKLKREFFAKRSAPSLKKKQGYKNTISRLKIFLGPPHNANKNQKNIGYRGWIAPILSPKTQKT